jgi:TatD DNase family protein
VEAVICCGSDLPDSRACLKLAKQYDYIYAACGIHPHESGAVSEADYAALRTVLRDKRCVALGEIGLDYHYDFSPREAQRTCLRRQLALARELGLPVILHDREAHEDMLRLLQEHRPRGVVHCYSGSVELARTLLGLGLYLGFGGAVTFKNAKKAIAVAAQIPLERLLLETDAPYMTPEPHRGTRCDSTHIRFTAQRIAAARGMETQTLIDAANRNARELFSLET